jgi:flagellar basal-body rod protein FlgB
MLDHLAKPIESYMTTLSVRERLIAGNIANADTPGYRTRDIEFQREFERALSGHDPEVVEVGGLQMKNDGNNVSIDREMRMISESALRFNAASNFARSEIRRVRAAMDDGRQS